MQSAIGAHVRRITDGKGVGLVYYAGHGMQLSWTNFLVPVDAVIRRAEDVQASCVDLSVLMDGARRAANAMNIIILDACRDNPFARDAGASGQGLSQMDAPSDTLLAYATAPGNVASDGDAANGLYTESLLKEIREPGTRIEDVFKRVRLNVRRKTRGAQVPWESTSLEEDFWFLPPPELVRVAEEQERVRSEQKLREELSRWERIRNSRNADDFYAFLLERPSGFLAEQAQFRLDQLEKPVVQAQPGPNGIKVLPSGINRYAVGDVFEFDLIDRLTNLATRTVSRVTYADNDRVEFNRGAKVVDQMGGVLKDRFGTKEPANVAEPSELAVGKRWRSAFTNTRPDGVVASNFWEFHVVALEDVSVPAGTFKAYRVTGDGWSTFPGGAYSLSITFWTDPVTMISVRIDREFRTKRGQIAEYSTTQLVRYTRAPR
jgi:hypothetical protein